MTFAAVLWLFAIIVIIGLIVWALRRIPTLDPPFKTAILVVGVVLVVLVILHFFAPLAGVRIF